MGRRGDGGCWARAATSGCNVGRGYHDCTINASDLESLAMEFGGELSASDIAKCSLAQQLDRSTNTWAMGASDFRHRGRSGEERGRREWERALGIGGHLEGIGKQYRSSSRQYLINHGRRCSGVR